MPPEAVEQVLAAVEASTAGATKRAYRSDWARFTVWTRAGGVPPLPAPPVVVAAYVTAAAAEQEPNGRFRYAPSTLTRWVSSINQVHAAAGLEAPGRAEIVRRALSGIRRIRATPPTRRAPLLLEDIRTLLDWLSLLAGSWPAGVAARRDVTLLLMGFAGAFRRSELVALTVGDVSLHRSDGLHVRLRRSKTDQEAAGVVRALPYGRDPATCAPCAWTRWRELLHASATARPGEERREIMRVLRRQARLDNRHRGRGDGEDAGEGRHVCRTTRLQEAAHPEAPLFPSVHGTARSVITR